MASNRLNAYAIPSPSGAGAGGSVQVDVKGMMIDLVTVFKAGGYTLKDLKDLAIRCWKEVHVEVHTPPPPKAQN